MATGDDPVWPEATGKRAFAYLKLSREFPSILRTLEEQQLCSLIYVDRLPFRLKTRYESDRLQFAPSPVNLEVVGRECDLVILNGGHGSTASLLLSGRPILQIPMNLEQALTGLAVERMQAGLCVNPERPTEMPLKLRALVDSDKYAAGAARFAKAHHEFNRARQLDLLVERVCELAGSVSTRTNRPIGNGRDEGAGERAASLGGLTNGEPAKRRVVRKPLPTDLAAVSVFFNPAGYRSTVENFRKFYRSVRDQGIELHAVEIAFGDATFDLSDLPGVLQVRTQDVMWQLERMINHTITGLAERFTKVVWLDTDVFFENPNWFQETSEALDQKLVVQPFREAVWLDAEGGELRRMPGMVSGMKNSAQLAENPAKMHPGFAWGSRRELISKHGLPDFCILGGADRVFANAIYDVEWAREMSYYPAALQQRIRDWKTGIRRRRAEPGHLGRGSGPSSLARQAGRPQVPRSQLPAHDAFFRSHRRHSRG